MERNTVSTDKAPSAIGPYSQGVAAGPWLFVSGQLGMNPETGELVGDDLAAQARQALDNLKAVVEAGGCTLADVTAVEVFLTDMGSTPSTSTCTNPRGRPSGWRRFPRGLWWRSSARPCGPPPEGIAERVAGTSNGFFAADPVRPVSSGWKQTRITRIWMQHMGIFWKISCQIQRFFARSET